MRFWIIITAVLVSIGCTSWQMADVASGHPLSMSASISWLALSIFWSVYGLLWRLAYIAKGERR